MTRTAARLVKQWQAAWNQRVGRMAPEHVRCNETTSLFIKRLPAF